MIEITHITLTSKTFSELRTLLGTLPYDQVAGVIASVESDANQSVKAALEASASQGSNVVPFPRPPEGA